MITPKRRAELTKKVTAILAPAIDTAVPYAKHMIGAIVDLFPARSALPDLLAENEAQAKEIASFTAECGHLEAENERLTKERELERRTYHDNQWQQLKEALAESERLREALKPFGDLVIQVDASSLAFFVTQGASPEDHELSKLTHPDDQIVLTSGEMQSTRQKKITWGDLRRAAETPAEKPET